jgi:hypothetical protein
MISRQSHKKSDALYGHRIFSGLRILRESVDFHRRYQSYLTWGAGAIHHALNIPSMERSPAEAFSRGRGAKANPPPPVDIPALVQPGTVQ